MAKYRAGQRIKYKKRWMVITAIEKTNYLVRYEGEWGEHYEPIKEVDDKGTSFDSLYERMI